MPAALGAGSGTATPEVEGAEPTELFEESTPPVVAEMMPLAVHVKEMVAGAEPAAYVAGTGGDKTGTPGDAITVTVAEGLAAVPVKTSVAL